MAQDDQLDWEGLDLVDRDGHKIGSIGAIYVDRKTETPEWALVKTGLLGNRSSFVPLAQAEDRGDHVIVPYTKAEVKEAPSIDEGGELTGAEEDALYRYYGLEGDEPGAEPTVESDRDLMPDQDETGSRASAGDEGDEHLDRGTVAPVPAEPPEHASEEDVDIEELRRQGGEERRIRRYVVTEEVVRRVEPVDDDEPGR